MKAYPEVQARTRSRRDDEVIGVKRGLCVCGVKENSRLVVAIEPKPPQGYARWSLLPCPFENEMRKAGRVSPELQHSEASAGTRQNANCRQTRDPFRAHAFGADGLGKRRK